MMSKLGMIVENIYTVLIANEIHGYNVVECHEWSEEEKKDLEFFDRMPVLKITSELMDYIENGMNELPEQLLKDIEGKTKVKVVHEWTTVKYAFVATDGQRVIAVNTNESDRPRLKGRLVPRMEQVIYDITEGVEPTAYEFTKPERVGYLFDPKIMIGLTRKERQKKQVLYYGLQDFEYEEHKNLSKIKYYYGEFNYKGLDSIGSNTFDEILHRLMDEVKVGWTKAHDQLTKLIVSTDEYLAELYYALD